jgi:ubiquinone/menaquinone biosynthesis C-methylase UbiE
MKLNLLERIFITSPVRPFLQKHLEAKQLLKMGGPNPGAVALEIGCGAGSGIGLIYTIFGAARVDAFDLDAKMVSLARRQQINRPMNSWVGNVRFIPTRSSRYDAVFNFGVIHHVVDWRDALAEVYRVLKPGGRFYCEEILSRYITHPVIGKLMDHPQEDRFDQSQFIRELEASGFQIQSVHQKADLYLWVIATK